MFPELTALGCALVHLTFEEDVSSRWGPVTHETGTSLYLARQWKPFDAVEHQQLANLTDVTGLVFSSFRYDNPNAVTWDVWPI